MNTRAAWTTVLALAIALITTGCRGTDSAGDRPDPTLRSMSCTQPADRPSGMQVLLAQAVPTASALPCLSSRAGYWTVTGFRAENGRARIEFSYRHGGDDTATVDLTADCDPGSAQEVASQFDAMRKYRLTATRKGRYADEIHYRYPGACTSLRFDLTGYGADLRAAEIAGALGFVPREHLDRQIRQASNGHLRLDPRRSRSRRP